MIAPTEWQARVLGVPESYDLALLGGRGGGKSFSIALIILRHSEQFAGRARTLFVRRTHAALADFELVLRSVFGAAYSTGARYNAQDGVWRLGNGAIVELSQLSTDDDYSKYQGRGFSLIVADEATQHPTPRLLDLLRSNLRSEKGVPTRVVIAANPGGVGHGWCARRHVRTGVAPWRPYTEPDTGRTFVTCPSTLLDNPHVDQSEYRRQLEAACASDPELMRAWVEGDWSVARGAFFADVISEKRSLIEPWNPENWPGRPPRWVAADPERARRHSSFGWGSFLAHDYGSSAPSVTYLVVRSPGEAGPDHRWYPRDSIILLDELATVDPTDPARGLGWTIPQLSEAIREMAERWGVRPQGVADDACFAKGGHAVGSIADEFRRERVHFRPAKKGSRVAGWQRLRRLLQDSGKPDRPGLYVSRACRYWWETVPLLPRDPRRPEDLDSRGPDHAADASRYGVSADGHAVAVRDLPI